MAKRFSPRPVWQKAPDANVNNPATWKRWLYGGSSSDLVRRLSALKSSAPYIVQQALAPRICESPLFRAIAGTLLPASYQLLHSIKPKVTYSPDWTVEILWNATLFAQHSELLNRFIIERRLFDRHVILGQLDEAETQLSSFIAEFGVSLWSLEQQFLLKQGREGFQGNKAFLSDVQSARCDPFINYLATLFSLRVEQNVTPEYFYTVLRQKVYSVWPDAHNLVREYICSYAEPATPGSVVNKSYCVWKDNAGSIFDRYVQTLKIVRKEIAAGLPEESKERLISIFSFFSSNIQDASIKRIVGNLEGSAHLNKTDESLSFNDALDAYTRGDYPRAVEAARVIIERDPLDFAPYELLAKASVHAKIDAPTITASDSVANNLVSHLTAAYADNELYERAEQALPAVVQHLGERPLAFGLAAQLEEGGSLHSESARLSHLYASLDNPIDHVGNSSAEAIKWLQTFQVEYSESISAQFLVDKLTLNIVDSRDTYGVDPLRWRFAAAEALIKKKRPGEALSLLEQTSSAPSQLPKCLVSTAIRLKFQAYRELGEAIAALRLFVAEYLSDKHLVRALPVSSFLEEVASSLPAIVLVSLEYLIARAVIAETPQQVYEALDDFLAQHGCERPRDILAKTSDFDPDLLSFTIATVMQRNILSRGGYCRSTAALDDERLFLLNSLGTLGGHRSAADLRVDVREEIRELNKELLVREASQHVNAGRVSVNFEQIRDAADPLRLSFKRYHALRKAEEELNITLIPLSSILLEQDDNTGKSTPTKVKESLTAFGEIYFRLLFDICLLHEAYGLDAILSARIRHGSLSNLIRSPFELGSLITRKNVAREQYLPSEHWQSLFDTSNVSVEVSSQFQSALGRFTQSVDNAVAHFQKELLQIRLPNLHSLQVLVPQYTSKPEGMFDYTDLFYRTAQAEEEIGRTSNSIEEVVARLLDLFVSYTNELLGKIRTYVEVDLQRQLRGYVGLFLKEVRDLDVPDNIKDAFRSEVVRSQTALQNTIRALSDWFHFKGPQDFPDMPLDVACEAVLKAINNSSGSLLTGAQRTIPDLTLKGDYFHSVYDIFFTLLYNVVEHSDLPQASIDLKVVCIVSSNEMTLTIANRVNADKDLGACVDAANHLIQSVTQSSERRVAGEGHSGFLKIRKILEQGLKRKRVDMEALAVDGEFQVRIQCDSDRLFVTK